MEINCCPKCGTALGATGICAKCLLETGFDAEDRTRAERLFQAALAHDEKDRASFVAMAAGADTTLLAEVRMLLEGYAESGGDLAAPTMGPAATARSQWAAGVREEPGTVIDHFRLVRLVGTGGMGSVWEAEQTEPIKRRVALKVIKLGMDTEEVVRRFERERRALALMTHPHIAQVYEAGATPLGRPYFAMELVSGETITSHCQAKGLNVRERLTLFLDVCEAVEHAHQKGVIHRDLKPSNILVADGKAKVIDFGVAKATREDARDGLFTRQAQMLGTPAYMSPEQAETDGLDVDTRTDVYSLGVVLYELLSGSLPFDPQRLAATGIREMQRILREEQPSRPSTRLMPGKREQGVPQTRPGELHSDLDWIVMKALSKERERRYSSAAVFAEDVRRYLAGEAVSAVPPTLAYQFGKFVRRNRVAVASAAAVLAALAAGLVISLFQASRANRALAGQTRARQEATFAVADMYARFGLAAEDKGESSRAALWFTNAAIIAAADPARADANRLRAATWTADSRVPVRAFETGFPHIERIVFHPDGKALSLTKIDGTGAQVWDLETESPSPLTGGATVDSVEWDASGTLLCLAQGNSVRVLKYPSGEMLAETGVSGTARGVAFDPQGQRIAVASHPPFLWDWKSGVKLPAAEVPGGLKSVRWSPDGTQVLWQSMGMVGICDAGRPERLLFEPVKNSSKCLADFTGNSERFFHGPPGENHTFVRKAATGTVVAETTGGDYPLAASPDGQLIARAHAPLWPPSGGAARTCPVHHANNLIESAQFSRDGSLLATAGYDSAVRLWSVKEDRALGPVGWHQHPVQCVAFNADASLLASSQIGLVRVWRMEESCPARRVQVGAPTLFALSGDGAFLVPAGITNQNDALPRTRVYETATGKASPLLDAGGLVVDAAFSPDQTWVAVACSTTPQRATYDWRTGAGSGSLHLWNWRTGERIGAPVALPSEPRGLAVHPSGEWIAVYCAHGEGLEWERKSGTLRTLFTGKRISIPQSTLNNGRCAYSADGRFLTAWGELDDLHLWDRRTGRDTVQFFDVNSATFHDVCLRDGVAALSPMGPPAPLVSFLDTATGREAAPALAHSDWLYLGRFDTTGNLLMTCGRRPVVQVWNWRTGTLAGPALHHESDVMAGLFLPGTPWVVTGAHDGQIRFWDFHSGMPVRPPVQCPGLVLQLSLTPDGKSLLASGFLGAGEIDIIDLTRALPPVQRELNAAGERLLAEINAGATVHEGGGLVPLTGEGWLKKWQEFRHAFPGYKPHRLSPG